MEINRGGKMYANNTIIANNASKQVGGAINCTVSGNVTTARDDNGGGIGLHKNNPNKFYAANCIFVNNYYLDQENNQAYASDIGILGNSNVVHLYNCLYNSIVKFYTSDDNQNVKIVDCRTGTEDQNVAKAYRDDGIFLSKDEISQGFLHPAVIAKPETSGVGLYSPIQGGGLATAEGTNTYFDFSDLDNIKMGYGSDDNIIALGNLDAPATTAKISNYYEDGLRETGIIGASGIETDDYYTVKLGDYSNGTVEGATFYGDTKQDGTSVTVRAIENVDGYVFKYWIATNSDGDEEIIMDNPYTFEISDNITLLPEFVEGYRYYVVFDGNSATSGEMEGTSFISVSDLDGDVEQHLPANNFSRSGYIFTGWNTEADGTGMSYEDRAEIINLTDVANDTVVMYAQWQKDKKDHQESEPDINDRKSYGWNTIENSGGIASGGNSTSSQTQSPSAEIALENNKNLLRTESKIPKKLRTRKYLFGYSDGTIKPENYVTNAELATIIYKLMNDGETINYDKLKNIGVEKSDWFADAVAYLIDDSRKMISITDEKFNPNKNITGYEMLNIIHNILKFYGADKNFVIPQDLIDLNSYVTRLGMTQIIFNVFERKSNSGQKIYSDLDNQHWAYNFLMDASE